MLGCALGPVVNWNPPIGRVSISIKGMRGSVLPLYRRSLFSEISWKSLIRTACVYLDQNSIKILLKCVEFDLFSVENSDQLSVKCVGGKILKIHFHSFRVPVQGQGVTWKRLVICRLNDAAAGPSALILNNHEAPFILFSLWLFLREPIIRCGTDLGPFGRWSHDNQWTWCFLQVSSSLRTDSGERER